MARPVACRQRLVPARPVILAPSMLGLSSGERAPRRSTMANAITMPRCVRFLVALLLTGCASSPGVMLPPGTLNLGEVSHVLTAEQIEAGRLGPYDRDDTLGTRVSQFFSADQIARGQVFVIRTGIYWNNTVSGIKHDMLRIALAPDDVVVEPGNVVEMAVGDARLPLTIRRVRGKDLAAGPCFYDELPNDAAVDVMGALSLVGPRGAATLYCRGIEAEGWVRPRSFWHKLPGAMPAAPEQAASAGAAIARPVPARPVGDTAQEPEAPPAELARLILRRNNVREGMFFALPVDIDGHRVAALDAGYCEVVLLGPGRHVVEAGTAAMGDMLGLPKLSLELNLAAGEQVVAEYVVDAARWQSLSVGMQGLFTSREVWGPDVFGFTQRPATARDRCAIRHAPLRLPSTPPAQP